MDQRGAGQSQCLRARGTGALLLKERLELHFQQATSNWVHKLTPCLLKLGLPLRFLSYMCRQTCQV